MVKPIIDVLSDAIKKIRKRILRLKDRKEKIGEENTKATLIDPILRAAGWNTGELDEVRREYRRKSKDNPVDYALFLLRKECLFIEAKALEMNVDDHKWILQTLGYATAAGVEWCVLTNGDEYRLYNSHAPVPAEEKLFRKFQISDIEKHDFSIETLQLISKDKMKENRLKVLWRAHFIDSKVKVALQEILSPESKSIIPLIEKRTQGIKQSEIKESLKRTDVQIDFPIMPIVSDPPTGESDKTKITVSVLIAKGLIKPPLSLETVYKGSKFKATIQKDSTILFDGEIYKSLSTAAGMARVSLHKPPKGRKYPQTNGWKFWKYRDPHSGELLHINFLRNKYNK